MGLFQRRKEKPKAIEPDVVEIGDQTPEVVEEPQVDWRITQAIKHIEEGKRRSASLRRGSSGLTTYYAIKCMDGATCEHCKKFDRQKFFYEDAVLGVNYPPFNCCGNDRCRCMAIGRME